MKGWIALNRRLRESEIWLDGEPFCPRSAWVDILFMANWKDKTWHDKTRAVSIPRGSFVTSILSLSERWKWSRGKISRFLSRLVELEMISIEKNKNSEAKWTLVTVRNYDLYQRFIDPREVDADTGRTLDEHWTDTGKTLDGHWTDITEQRNNITKKQRKKILPAELVSELVYPVGLSSPECKAAHLEWIEHRQKIKKPLTRESHQEELNHWSAFGPEVFIRAIRATKRLGHQGLRDYDAPKGGNGRALSREDLAQQAWAQSAERIAKERQLEITSAMNALILEAPEEV